MTTASGGLFVVDAAGSGTVAVVGGGVRIDLGEAGIVEGEVDPQFQPVLDAFVRNFSVHGDTGAAVCVYHQGRKVVDLWGGWASPSHLRPFGPDTLQLVFSTTKGATALCALIMAERGLLDIDAPVAEYWPEFGTPEKRQIPVRWLLTHEAGLPVIDAELPLERALAWTPVTDALVHQRPLWEPGSAHGYHALTFGWLVGEVVRRVTGRSLGTFFADEVAAALGLDFWIGLPASEETRVAPLRMQWPPAPFGGPGGGATGGDQPVAAGDTLASLLQPEALQLLLRALTLNGTFGMFGGDGPFNSPAVHSAEVPAANGITDARSLARMYAALVGDVDGVRLLAPDSIDAAARPRTEGRDRVLVAPTTFGLGFMCHSRVMPLLAPGSFGHSGAGGSLGFADPGSGTAFGYVMNQMRLTLTGDVRTVGLIEGLRLSLR
ncbi:MAG TPA: serine hydrolase domain-containing protein [Acidimicrobiales bacterium]|nr:serine hydrolase domain-containing protein [Acidimicrobiales bacterium]